MGNFFRLSATFLVCQFLALGGVGAETLPDLIQSSLLSHPSVRAQEALGRAADDGVSTARWQYFPVPSIGVERVASSSQSPAYGYGDGTVTTMRLQQPLWTGGRLSAGVAKAEFGVALSRADIDVARQELALRIVQTYAEWRGGGARQSVYEKSLRSHLRLREQILRRIKEGVSPQTDLTLVLGRIEQTQGELIAARAQQSAALSRLGQILGRAVSADELKKSVAQPLAIGVMREMVESAQEVSPVVARKVAAAKIQQLEVDERRADLSPEVYLRMERQYGNFSLRGAAPDNRIFLGVSTRFGAGLSVVSAVDAARGRYEASLAEVDSARITLSDQMYADYMQAESGNSRLVALKASLNLAESTSQAWDRQFLAGQKSWLDVMNSVREVAQTEAQIADLDAAQLLVTWRLVLHAKGVDALIASVGGVSPLPEKDTVPAVSAVRPAWGGMLRLETTLRWPFVGREAAALPVPADEEKRKAW